nr:hypothetical protein [Desulfobulbaceae bacterium]
MDGKLSNQTQKLLSEAEKASIRAQDLTQQLLTFSKGGDPVKKTSSIYEIIKDSANFILHGSSVSCQYEIADDLLCAEIDTGQISQVIQNLILNAKQAMPSGGIIKVSCVNTTSVPNSGLLPDNRPYIKIDITDQGVGIDKNIIDKIFDPYFSTKKDGSGLGLAIVHSIIAKHNGHISAHSELGGGTVFTVFLPAVEAAETKVHLCFMTD